MTTKTSLKDAARRLAAVLFASLVLASGLFFVNLRPVHASFGGQIICFVYDQLNHVGTPIPVLNADGCTGTPTPTTGSLKIVKIVSGTTTLPEDFQIHVKSGGTDIGGSPQPGSSIGTVYDNLDGGTYTVSEDPNAAYTQSFSGDCSLFPPVVGTSAVVTVTASTTKTCTVTNTYTPPPPGAENTLALCSDGIDNNGNGLIDLADPDCAAFKPEVTINKVVVNTGGGTKQVSDFSLFFDGLAILSGHATTTTPGAHAFSETPTAHYIASWSGACDGAGHVSLAIGDSKTCTLTNTYTSSTSTDIAIQKSVSTSTPAVGDTVVYTLTVTNNGPDAATGVVVTDVLPGGVTYVSDDSGGTYGTTTGRWTVGSLGSGAHATLHITVAVNSGTGGQSIINIASASSTTADPSTDNNTSAPTTITPVATTTPPADVCPNIEGTQTSVPSGKVLDGSGNCVDQQSGGGGSAPVTTRGGGGGGGPIGLFGTVSGGGQVLGTSTIQETGTGTPACGAYLTDYLRLGRANNPDQVRKLQTFLNTFMNAGLPVTGYFGPLTDSWVRKFQLQHGDDVLAPWVPYGLSSSQTSTGYVYKTTLYHINLMMCQSLNAPKPVLP